MNYMMKYTAYFGSVQRLYKIITIIICSGPNLVY